MSEIEKKVLQAIPPSVNEFTLDYRLVWSDYGPLQLSELRYDSFCFLNSLRRRCALSRIEDSKELKNLIEESIAAIG